MSLETYLAYLATVLVFFARPPGPSQLLFMAHSMQRGVKRSVPVMAGDLSANTIQILIAGFGLAAIATSSALYLHDREVGRCRVSRMARRKIHSVRPFRHERVRTTQPVGPIPSGLHHIVRQPLCDRLFRSPVSPVPDAASRPVRCKSPSWGSPTF